MHDSLVLNQCLHLNLVWHPENWVGVTLQKCFMETARLSCNVVFSSRDLALIKAKLRFQDYNG